MQVHRISDVTSLRQHLRGVNELFAKRQPIVYIVTTPAPLPSVHVVFAVPCHVTAAVRQVPNAA